MYAQNLLSIPHSTIHVHGTVHVSKLSTNLNVCAHGAQSNMGNRLTLEGRIYIQVLLQRAIQSTYNTVAACNPIQLYQSVRATHVT